MIAIGPILLLFLLVRLTNLVEIVEINLLQPTPIEFHLFQLIFFPAVTKKLYGTESAFAVQINHINEGLSNMYAEISKSDEAETSNSVS